MHKIANNIERLFYYRDLPRSRGKCNPPYFYRKSLIPCFLYHKFLRINPLWPLKSRSEWLSIQTGCHGERFRTTNMLLCRFSVNIFVSYPKWRCLIADFMHFCGCIQHAAGKRPFIVIPGHNAHEFRFYNLCAFKAEHRGMRIVIKIT